MQKDNQNVSAEQNSATDIAQAVESEENSAPGRKPASAKKSPAKKATATTKKTTKKTSAVEKKPIAEEKEAVNEADNEEVLAQLENAEPPIPSPEEITENPKSEEENDSAFESKFIIPDTAVFTIPDNIDEEISIIGDDETENDKGLLNVEHFSDYSPSPASFSEPDSYYEAEASFEEDITLLTEETPEPYEIIEKKDKYEDPDREKYNPKKPRKVDARFDFIELFVFTLLAVILLTTFVFRHAVVEGPSMQNTLQDGEHLIISNLFYTPEKGDIIVCQDRETGHYEPVVKRVVATAGDTIEVIDSIVYLNGEKMDETNYVLIDGKDNYANFPEVTVPEGMIFVMGDHRNNSADSRAFITTFVREDAVLGKVILRFYPFDQFGRVD